MANLHAQDLDATFAALADPTRRAILARLAEGEAAVGELGKPFAMTPPAITKHLKVLEGAGLIARRREAQSLICRLHAAPLEHAATWLEFYRRFFAESFVRLDGYLQEMNSGEEKAEAKGAGKHAGKKEGKHSGKKSGKKSKKKRKEA